MNMVRDTPFDKYGEDLIGAVNVQQQQQLDSNIIVLP